jgi:hypothetical protein
MYPLGTCNGVQDATEVQTGTLLMSQPFVNGSSEAGFSTKRSGGASPDPLVRSPLPREDKQEPVCAATVPSSRDVSFIGSRHCQYLPFLFQTARVEVGPLVKED